MVATVEEEQLHALVRRVCDPRLARAKDVGVAMGLCHVEEWMRTHPVTREQLLSLKRKAFDEAARAMAEL